jgi:hypothetical protein
MPVVIDRHFFASGRLRRKIIFSVSRVPFIPGIAPRSGLRAPVSNASVCSRRVFDYFEDEREMPLFKVLRERLLLPAVFQCTRPNAMDACRRY